MRSVSSRKSSRGRAKPARRDARKTGRAKSSKPQGRQTFGRRKTSRIDILMRRVRDIGERFAIRRPVLYLAEALLALTVIAGLFAGGYVRGAIDRVDGAAEAVSSYAGFGITKLHLAGADRTNPQTVLAVLNFKPGQSIFGADLQMARARLMRLPWVKQAQVTRRYPDSISVDIVEKKPFALWRGPKHLYVIERSGAIITTATPAQFSKLPVFAGDPPKGGDRLVEAIAAHRAVAARVQIMQRISGRRWNLILDDGVVVELPETGWQKQLGVLEHLIVDKGVLERDIKEIDLRLPDNYFFQLRGQEKPKPAIREHAA